MNKKEFKLSGITRWHTLGYTGKNIRIANMEETDPTLYFFDGKVISPFDRVSGVGKNYHGHQTADILHQVAPDATIYTLSSGGTYGAGKASGRFIEESIPFMESENIHLVNASLGGTANTVLRDRIIDAQKHGVTFVTSAGNEAEQGVGGYARSGAWIAVGAVSLADNGTIMHASYSSLGEEVDFTQFSSIYIHDATDPRRTFPVRGTSFSAPMLCGMLALVQEFFLERAGRTLFQHELYEFMKNYSIDLWEPGRDLKSGHGLFLLPNDPNSIDISKYIGGEPEVNNPEYIIIHHSDTAEGDAEAFRRYHKEQRGWRDIGYHYVINNGTYQPDGKVEIGRTEYEAGAHTIGYNNKSIGICLVGDFERTGPTALQMESLVRLTKDVMTRHKIPPNKVVGHKEVYATTCPGRHFDLEAFRRDLMSTPQKKDWEGHSLSWGINTVIQKGIMIGDVADGSKFRPDDALTRAEFANAIAQLFDKGYLK